MAVRAQPLSVIGVLNAGDINISTPLLQGLREEGFVEGQTIMMEYRLAKGSYDRLPLLAAELIALRVDVIVAQGTAAAHAAKEASTRTTPAIPIVFSLGSDPVAQGFVASMNRPGGNMTGTTSIGSGLAAKRLDLMREFLRDNDAVAILINPANPADEAEQKDAEMAARSIGRRLETITARDEDEIEKAFAVIKERRIGALIIANDTFFFSQMQRFATLAGQYAVPVMGTWRDFATAGGLLSYGINIAQQVREVGIMVGKVLKGTRPADLPVQQPTKFDLVVNLKAAKKLGIDLSPKLLALADEVIE